MLGVVITVITSGQIVGRLGRYWPFLVGISWVVRCAEIGQCVPEDQYLVDGGKEPTFQKVRFSLLLMTNVAHKVEQRRKSMEPRALASLGSFGGMTATDPAREQSFFLAHSCWVADVRFFSHRDHRSVDRPRAPQEPTVRSKRSVRLRPFVHRVPTYCSPCT